MRHFFDWFAAEGLAKAPWLILGKGPSFAQIHARDDIGQYRLLSLNHVVRERRVDIAHMIDIDVAIDCMQEIFTNAGVLVMPWRPHVNNACGGKTLSQWTDEVPALKALAASGRLLWYDLSTCPERHGPGPLVRATAFSSEAALDLLALAGVKTARSLGVDGGTTYASSFGDLKDTTRLNNGQISFDFQFQGLARTIMTTGIDFSPLGVDSPIRVYVGSEEAQMLSVKVLEHSIRRHTSMSVEVFPLHRANIKFAQPKDPKNWPRTPFSFQRFTIPMLAGHQGRAIYLDSDMLVFRDLRELWSLPLDGADVLASRSAEHTDRRPQFSVMLLDCSRLAWTPELVIESLDSGRLNYEQLMHEMALASNVRAGIAPEWNSLEHYEPGRTALLHYTDMTTQPWVYVKNPNGYLWMRELLLAVDDGSITIDEIQEHIDRQWVRPSLLRQVLRHRERPLKRSIGTWFDDRKFEAPYKRIRHG